ncbi:hypothetical protein [Yoonia sp.]|uniref:hypothetical protein n=1 Tax=Yoonia sp. TaxID=2212373 RepID=UPI003F6D3E23
MFTQYGIRRFMLAALLVTAAAGGAAVHAQEASDDDDDMMPVTPFGFGPGIGGMALMSYPVDVDGDGLVTAAEASRHAAISFALFDVDGDDALTEDEFIDSAFVAMPMGRRGTERLFVNRRARFAALDANGDGTVTRAEFINQARTAYDAADADGDAAVTVWEFRAQRNPF